MYMDLSMESHYRGSYTEIKVIRFWYNRLVHFTCFVVLRRNPGQIIKAQSLLHLRMYTVPVLTAWECLLSVDTLI